MKTCFFIGHHDAPDSLQERLNAEVERLVRFCNVTTFIVGHYGNFDRMATAAVQKAKLHRPDLCAYRLTVYHPSEREVLLPELFDDTYYPLDLYKVPRRYAIPRGNRMVLNESDCLIAYVARDGGNAGALLKYAHTLERKKYLHLVNLAEEDA